MEFNRTMCGAIHIKKASNSFRLTISYDNLIKILNLFKASREYIRVRKHGMLDLVEIELTCGHSLPSLINLLRGFDILEFDIVQLQPLELNLSMPRMA